MPSEIADSTPPASGLGPETAAHGVCADRGRPRPADSVERRHAWPLDTENAPGSLGPGRFDVSRRAPVARGSTTSRGRERDGISGLQGLEQRWTGVSSSQRTRAHFGLDCASRHRPFLGRSNRRPASPSIGSAGSSSLLDQEELRSAKPQFPPLGRLNGQHPPQHSGSASDVGPTWNRCRSIPIAEPRLWTDPSSPSGTRSSFRPGPPRSRTSECPTARVTARPGGPAATPLAPHPLPA